MKNPSHYSRRKFIFNISYNASLSALSLYGLSGLASCQQKTAGETNAGEANADTKREETRRKLGIALVGLGKYSTDQLAPALAETNHCYLAGIVTGTPDKIEKWKGKYDIPEKNIYNYATFDQVKDNLAIDIVYVVLPNAMHKEYVVRAARAGKHVMCEKPMAVTTDDCDAMIAACKQANKMLSIGYRLHFEPHNQEVMKIGHEKVFGNIKKIIAENGMKDTEGWRLDKELAGGGALMDVGIYCVQAVRYSTGMEPVAVTAQHVPKKDSNKFREVEESLFWQMEMPQGIIAECKTSYSQEMNRLRGDADKGWFELSPAYAYKGIDGKTSDGEMDLTEVNQQARQMDDFAQAIINGRPTPVPGEMGKQDVKILQAIYKAARSGGRVEIV